MSVNDDDQQTSFQSERGLFIAGLLLFLLGGLYWLFSTPPVTYPAAPQTETVSEPAATAAETNQQPDESADYSLTDQPDENRVEATRTKKPVITAKANRVAGERAIKSPTHEAAEPARQANEATPLPVEKPVVAVTPPAQPEAAPLPRTVQNPILAKAETKKKTATEAKPLAQPTLPSAPASTSAAFKRKTKNDEDVEVDF